MSRARLRRGLLALATASTAGIAVELAMLRHWESTSQLLGWAALAPLVAGLACAASSSGRRWRRLVTWLIGAVAALAAYGTYVHVAANLDAGPLDFRYAERWNAMSTRARWWAPATGSCGAGAGARARRLRPSGRDRLARPRRHPEARWCSRLPTPARHRTFGR